MGVWGWSSSDTTRQRENQDAWVGRGPAAACLDGLGGHGDGQVAAAAGVDAFDGALAAALAQPRPASALFDAMRTALRAAREAALAGGPGNPAMTAAVVVAAIDEHEPVVHLAWAGDCRAYLWSPRAPRMVMRATEDHDEIHHQWITSRCSDGAAARARAAVDRAQTEGEAFRLGGALAKKAFRRRNTMHAELATGEPTVRPAPLHDGGFVVLTTDGVHGNLTHPELDAVVTGHLESGDGALADLPELVCSAARGAGNEGSGRRHPDDVTCVALSR